MPIRLTSRHKSAFKPCLKALCTRVYKCNELENSRQLIQRFPALATAAIALGADFKLGNGMDLPEGDTLGVA